MNVASEDTYSVVDFNEKRRARTAKVTSVIVMLISLIWTMLGMFLGEIVVILTASMVVLTSMLTYVLAQTGQDLIARVLWMFSGTLAVVIGHFIVHPVANVEVMLLAMTGAPFILFSLHRERAVIYGLVALNGCSMIFMAATPQDLFGPPIVGYDDALAYLRWPSLLSVLAVLMFELTFFAWITTSYNRRLLESNRSAQQANRAKSAFLASMSHEIRTPMNGVVGMIEMLEDSNLDSEQRRMLRTIRESSFSLLRIIDDILDTSKIEAGRLELRPAPMHLLSVIEGVMDTMRPFADERKVDLRLQYDIDLPVWITADPGRLRQILINLLSNAVKFSAKNPDVKGEVSLVVYQTASKRLRMVVRDNGIGMDRTTLDQIFNPFSQAEEVTKRHFGGTGLGLTIVNQLLEKMGGSVLVESAPGKGSIFTVDVPIVAPDGVMEMPQLPNTTVYVVDAGGEFNETRRRYIEAMGARLVLCSSIQSVIAEVRNRPENVMILAEDYQGSTIESSFEQSKALRRAKVSVPTLLITNDRSMRTGMIEKNLFVVPSRPLFVSDVLNATRHLFDKQGQDVDLELAKSKSKARASVADAETLRLLVAEDNDVNRFVIEKQLASLKCTATIVTDGAEALAAWDQEEFDIVLTDCHMPNMNGFEFTEQVRSQENDQRLRRTPIIAITANALSGEADRCLAAGMDDFLSKPVQVEQLAKMLNKWRVQANK